MMKEVIKQEGIESAIRPDAYAMLLYSIEDGTDRELFKVFE